MAETPAAEKSAIRSKILRRRDAMKKDARKEFSRRILQAILRLDEYRDAEVVLAYASYGSELETGSFLASVLEQGKTLVLPRVDREKKALRLYEVADLDLHLVSGVWGIREPDAAVCPAVELGGVDFALIPGVAFDVRGGRLGHGAGYYDRLLGSRARLPRLVAAAFEVQVVEKLPIEPHDVLVDLVVTESGFYSAAGV